MTLQEFKNQVYDLAEFNSTLTKGYGKEWSEEDYKGYEYKNKKIGELVNIANENSYPVLYSGRQGVVYFLFGEVQISFHTGSLLRSENYGLPSTIVEWDGVKNAFKYSESEYIEKKKERKDETQKRIKLKAETESTLLAFSENYIENLKTKLKRARSERTKTALSEEIETLTKSSTYGLYEYFRFFDGIEDVCKTLTPMYYDSYIREFSV